VIFSPKTFEIDEYELYRADRKILGTKSATDCALYINDNLNVDERSNFIPQYMIGICGIVIFIKIHDMFVPNEMINWFNKFNQLLNNFSSFSSRDQYVLSTSLSCQTVRCNHFLGADMEQTRG